MAGNQKRLLHWSRDHVTIRQIKPGGHNSYLYDNNEGINLLNHHKACTWCFQIFSVISQWKSALSNAPIRLKPFVFLHPNWFNLKITVLVAKAVTWLGYRAYGIAHRVNYRASCECPAIYAWAQSITTTITTTASKRPSLMNNFLLRLKMLPIRKAVVKLSVMKVIVSISASIAKQRNHGRSRSLQWLITVVS